MEAHAQLEMPGSGQSWHTAKFSSPSSQLLQRRHVKRQSSSWTASLSRTDIYHSDMGLLLSGLDFDEAGPLGELLQGPFEDAFIALNCSDVGQPVQAMLHSFTSWTCKRLSGGSPIPGPANCALRSCHPWEEKAILINSAGRLRCRLCLFRPSQKGRPCDTPLSPLPRRDRP